ncbi:amino acid permease C-terminal domain-containing protein, partial [Curtobacterium sp. B8]|uniref:amino acid permease C-terminal domain-containing protein n=1 Tax=Curtobacterium sp. B8 TaxID=95611 RepID=UPI002738AF7E
PDATSMDTLVAFAIVNMSVIMMPCTQPGLERSYRVPLFPVVPVLGTVCCVLLAVFLGAGTWMAFGVWMVVGAALYLLWGGRHSTLR